MKGDKLKKYFLWLEMNYACRYAGVMIFIFSPVFSLIASDNLPVDLFSDSIKVDKVKVIDNAIEFSRSLHKENHDEELEYEEAEKALDLSLELGDTLLYAKSLDNMGLLYRYHQRYAEATGLHAKAYDLIVKEDSSFLAKMIYSNNAGVASRYGEDYESAVFYYLQALKIAESQEDLRNIAIACNGLGNTLLHIPGREEDALTYFERSLDAERERGNTLGIAMNYLSIGDYFTEKGDYKRGRGYLEMLLEINQRRKDDYGLGITYEYFGHNYLKEGVDLDQAAKYYKQSLGIFSKMNDAHKQADLLKALADVYRMNQQYDLAIEYYHKTWDLAIEIPNKSLIQTSASQLSSIYEMQSRLGLALKYYKISDQYKDSVNLINQETEIAAIEKRYALEQKESQIELLEKDRSLQQFQLDSQMAELKSQRIILVLLLMVLVAIAVIALMQFKNIKAKKVANLMLMRQNRQISEQKSQIEKVNEQLEATFKELMAEQKNNEEKRVKLLESKFENRIQSLALQSLESQMNPHFLFNGMNAVRWLVMKNKNAEAKEYIDTFAQLLRLSLTNNRKHTICLAEELKATELYLKIEKLRFDGGFDFQMDVSAEVNPHHIDVPPKILQPLVENAIKHGLLPSRKANKELLIRVFDQDEVLIIEVLDNGVGYRKQKDDKDGNNVYGTHLGLKLIAERLAIYNQQSNHKVDFNIKARYDQNKAITGTKAKISIVLEEAVDSVG
ncbi:tetratricopeptide repeat-containing sensor histidine kinase [Echinicola salinicaeni]|uniref:tetratricopeptide repeat-containing sensor histidine kinase n=1 Tax=Echinicola salinicaeni TaxID=2762757 RepID=UPI001E519A9C|nr:histidine kinase [Echinicola salinicaeni]